MAKRRRSTALMRRSTRYVTRSPRRRRKFTLPLAVVGGMFPTAIGVINRRDSVTAMGNFLQLGWTGIDPATNKFSLANMRYGAIPALGGVGVHMIASKLGLNRILAKAGIPIIRI
jgi:hypothetical protein